MRYNNIDLNNPKISDLINAGLKEFSKYGEKASQNEILKSANISKGGFYHYFKNKNEFYDFLIIYTLNILEVEIKKHVDFTNNDILERLESITLYEITLLEKNRYILSFFSSVKRDKIEQLYCEYFPSESSVMGNYHKNIDDSLLRDGIEVSSLIKHINNTTYGLIMRKTIDNNNVDTEMIKVEIKETFKLLRLGFYK